MRAATATKATMANRLLTVGYALVTAGAMISLVGAGLPTVLRACPRNSTDLNQCIIDVVNELRPRLATGDFGENFTITSLEPIKIDRLTIERGENFKANFTNFRISGATHEKTGFIVKKLKTDLPTRQINATLLLPKLQVNSKYSLKMSILVLQINGDGDLQVNLTDTKVSLKLTFYTEMVDGEEYFRFNPIGLKVKFGKARFYLKNLFNGDPTLEMIGNQAINENPDVLLDEVKGGIEENLAKLFTKIAGEVVKDALFEEVFPEGSPFSGGSSTSMVCFVALAVIACIGGSHAAVPPSIKVCSRNDPELSRCVTESVNDLRPRLASGKISDEFRIPPLEPLALSTVNMDRGAEFKATFSELLVSGPSKFKIDNLKVNIEKLIFDFNIFLPKLSFKGKYDLKIKLLLLNIAGVGDLTGVIENNHARVKLLCEKYTMDGKEYMRVKKLLVRIQIEKGRFDMKDLFRGDPVLSQAGNQFINENSRLFLDELTPGLERSLSDTFKSTANEIMQQATFDEIFPA
uniref:Uncharacterized protein n=1 Tax=Anopheles dirus TaxID=7168 RepID=A0A182NEN7_9DIPT